MADGNDALFYARVPVGTDGNGAMFYARVPEEATKLLDGAPFRVFVAILSFRRRDSETIEVSSRDIATKLGYRSRDSVRHLYPKILESGLLAREQVTAGRWVWRINFNLRGGSELGEGGGPNRSTPEQTHGARQWSRGARANGPGGGPYSSTLFKLFRRG